jgi:hypothetical protein
MVNRIRASFMSLALLFSDKSADATPERPSDALISERFPDHTLALRTPKCKFNYRSLTFIVINDYKPNPVV